MAREGLQFTQDRLKAGSCGVPIEPQKTGTVRRKPAIPPTRRPPSRQAPPQTGACETNNCAKKANFAEKLRSVCAEDHKRAVKVYKRDRCQKENQE